MKIIAFTKVSLPHGWLGNMSPHAVTHDGVEWRTAEHLFQALRFDHSGARTAIRLEKSPMAAKMTAKRWAHTFPMTVVPRSLPDLDNMSLVLKLKLEQHPYLALFLKATEDATLVEDVTARPKSESNDFWGMRLKTVASTVEKRATDPGVWTGENHLGKIWMRIRAELVT